MSKELLLLAKAKLKEVLNKIGDLQEEEMALQVLIKFYEEPPSAPKEKKERKPRKTKMKVEKENDSTL